MTYTITEKADLTHLNTLGLPVIASRLIEVFSLSGLITLSEEGFFRKENPFILGGGSNILLKRDLKRPVLKISITGIRVAEENDEDILIETGAGENWHKLVAWAVERNYGGIENLALIPGTVGAAPIQNIGAYGVELEQVFESLQCYDFLNDTEKTFRREECGFGYRDSIFKRELKHRFIITYVTLRLKKKNHIPNTSYHALAAYLEEKNVINPNVGDVFDAVVAIRRSKLPDPELLGNAGSFFKNPVVDKSIHQRISKDYPEVPAYPAAFGQVKIPAGWLIEKAGWKGRKVGNVGTYENQALVIVNHGGATGEEIYNHAMRIKESVKNMFGVELVPEVNVVE
ncbi:MAG: UDP-N-acetylmuramate dehydrogenase [Balneolaceae bacterium]|nr:MAG: UDP-N-acetylmuramate dehydrogenase [Balneolaceae bacterium]